MDEPACIYAQSTARVTDVLYLARRQKNLVHQINAAPASASIWMDCLTATGGRLPTDLREGRWGPWEHPQTTRSVSLYREQVLVLRAMFSEHTSYQEMLERLRHMVDWEFPIKLQVFLAGLLFASDDPTGIPVQGGARNLTHQDNPASFWTTSTLCKRNP